ncbi:MAG: exodeoxyribonuclease VII small subunit [Rhodospirillales bacterium]
MTGAEGAADIRGMSFEDALSELETIVRRLEEGSAKLDEAITAYERGALLKRHCESKLNEAQGRIEAIVLGADGSVTGTEPLAPPPSFSVSRD